MPTATTPSTMPLYVDLDGTVIKGDLTWESVAALLRANLLYLLPLPLWLCRGRAYLKRQLARRVTLDMASMPRNEEFMAYLERERRRGRTLILISASDQLAVTAMNDTLQMFSAALGSDGKTNLRSHAKLARIREDTDGQAFAYAGNSPPDLAVWEAAAEVIMVNAAPGLRARLRGNPRRVLTFDPLPPQAPLLLKALRPHQWLKNLLVFVPLILAHRLLDVGMLADNLIGFASFCLCASSVYLLNDVFDLENDRAHHGKGERPFASGTLPLAYGFALAPALLLAAIAAASPLPGEFMVVLLCYWLLTLVYSVRLKALFLADIFALAVLYSLRLAAGAAAVGIENSLWLIAFSLLLFAGLAAMKRYTELLRLAALGKTATVGRSYVTTDGRPTLLGGVALCAGAIGVFAIYLTAPSTRALYASPLLLAGVLPLLAMLIARLWRVAHRGELHDDPLLFLIEDRPSLAIIALCGAVVWLAS